MPGLFDKLGESIQGVVKGVAKGREAYVCSAEKRLRIERLKINIRDLREQKDQSMILLAHKIYEQYTKGTLQDPELLAACQEIKMLQWQIDERWTEVNQLNAEQ